VKTTGKLDELILKRIRDFPGAKFRDIFDLDAKAACSKISNASRANLFRVLDARLQSLRMEGVIEYKNGWRLKREKNRRGVE